jgi:hypothetical protein
MARSGRLRRPGRGLKHEDQSNPKTGPGTTLADGRFRLIVDGWATFRPGACTPPRRVLDDAVSPSTIRLKRPSTIAEIRTKPEPLTDQAPNMRSLQPAGKASEPGQGLQAKQRPRGWALKSIKFVRHFPKASSRQVRPQVLSGTSAAAPRSRSMGITTHAAVPPWGLTPRSSGERQRRATRARLAVRGTFSPPGPWRHAAGAPLARTLGRTSPHSSLLLNSHLWPSTEPSGSSPISRQQRAS